MRFFKSIQKSISVIAMLAAAGIAHADIVVIGNPAMKVDSLSQSQIGALYLKQNNSINDQTIKPLDQQQGSAVYQQFYQTMLNWSPSQLNSYWSAKVFSGGASQPEGVTDSADAIKLVERTPGLIAYVDSNDLAQSDAQYRVKVLYGKSPWHDYPSGRLIQHNRNEGGLVTASSYGLQSTGGRQVDKHPRALLTHSFHPYVNAIYSKRSLWPSIIAGFRLSDSSDHDQVKAQVQNFLRNRATLNVMLNNSIPYIGYVYQEVSRRHMPTEFALLPLLESAYNPFAYSRVGASGLWQMMPQTATLYGLNISWWYDARRDLLTSTKAALDYLQQLHHQFGDWLLSAAAYDEGSGAVSSAINHDFDKHAHASYWDLSLPRETAQYVPKLLALAYIVQHAKQYHVQLPTIPVQTFFTQVKLTSQMDLHQISQLSGVSENLILYLNPGMRRFATRPGTFMLLLPSHSVAEFERNLSTLTHHTHVSWLYHEVWRGETLAKIAHDYHTQVARLRAVNRMPQGEVRQGEGILVPVFLKQHYTQVANSSSHELKPSMAMGNLTAQDILSGQIDHAGGYYPSAPLSNDSSYSVSMDVHRKAMNLISIQWLNYSLLLFL